MVVGGSGIFWSIFGDGCKNRRKWVPVLAKSSVIALRLSVQRLSLIRKSLLELPTLTARLRGVRVVTSLINVITDKTSLFTLM